MEDPSDRAETLGRERSATVNSRASKKPPQIPDKGVTFDARQRGGLRITRMLADGVVAIVVGVAVGIAGPDVRRDGRWEVKMEMMMPNMPMAMPPTTVTQCVTKEDAADPQKAMAPQGRGA